MTFRTRFKKDIVCEFLPPARRPSNRVIILCYGMPGVPKDKATMEFWSKKGFWVFFPRYRGTWESDGEFLKKSPHLDILDVIDELPKGFTDLWSGNSYKPSAKSPTRTDTARSGGYKLFIFGGSFGGPAAILCSRDPRVTKAVAFAPVVDWEAPSEDSPERILLARNKSPRNSRKRSKIRAGEPMDKLGAFIPKGFGNGYRFSKKNWGRLSHNEFYSPVKEADTIDGKKLLIFHAKDDESCYYPSTKEFAQKTGAKLITLRSGGHFGFSKSIEPRFYKEIKKFLGQNRLKHS